MQFPEQGGGSLIAFQFSVQLFRRQVRPGGLTAAVRYPVVEFRHLAIQVVPGFGKFHVPIPFCIHIGFIGVVFGDGRFIKPDGIQKIIIIGYPMASKVGEGENIFSVIGQN